MILLLNVKLNFVKYNREQHVLYKTRIINTDLQSSTILTVIKCNINTHLFLGREHKPTVLLGEFYLRSLKGKGENLYELLTVGPSSIFILLAICNRNAPSSVST